MSGDGALAGWVGEQHGVVSRHQALTAGLSYAAIRSRIESGRWQRLYDGVYATFTGEPPRLSLLWAVLLVAGRGAVLSHHSAAELQGLLNEPAPRTHVSVPADRRVVAPPGLVVHVSARLEQATHPTRRPPQTRIEDTVVDLVHDCADVESALAWVTRAVSHRLDTVPRLRVAVAQRARLRWRAELAGSLDDLERGAHSPLETRYLHRVERAHGLPAGCRQARRERRGGAYYDDVRYECYGVQVELDGRAAHPAQQRFRDLRRDNSAVAAGVVVLRYGWEDVAGRPCAVAAQVATVLAARGWRGGLRRCAHCAAHDREGFVLL